MMLKENHSSLFEEIAARGFLGVFVFGGIAVFILGFALWSVLCMGGAIFNLVG